MKKLMWFASSLLLILSATLVNATTIFYNQHAFNNKLGQKFIDDYESEKYQFVQNDHDMSAVHNETKYIATGNPDTNIVSEPFLGDRVYCAGCNGSFLLDFTTTSLSDASGIFGVGINFLNVDRVDDNAGDPPITIPKYSAYVTFGNDLAENFILPSGPWPETHFWGITSTDGIKSIHFGFWDGMATQEGDFGLLDLTIGKHKSNVPEPNELMLLCLGFIAIMFRRKTFLKP